MLGSVSRREMKGPLPPRRTVASGRTWPGILSPAEPARVRGSLPLWCLLQAACLLSAFFWGWTWVFEVPGFMRSNQLSGHLPESLSGLCLPVFCGPWVKLVFPHSLQEEPCRLGFFVFCFSTLGLEPRALNMPGKRSSKLHLPNSLFSLYF